MLAYPVNVDEDRFVIYNLALAAPIAYNRRWPRADGMEFDSSNEDEVWLLMAEGSRPAPETDDRIYRIAVASGPDLAAQEWRTEYTLAPRPQAEIETRIDDTEANEVEKQIANNQFKKLLLLSIASLWRQVRNQPLTAREQALRDMALARAAKILNNDARSAELKAAVATALANATALPDLDSGWEAAEGAGLLPPLL